LFESPDRESEYVHLIDCVTTNKTDFFREPVHFQFLAEKLLPAFMQARGQENDGLFTLWSTACSTGEEPYTLAMVLDDFASKCPGFRYAITASDIATNVLEKARMAVYDEDQAACVPWPLKQKYLLRSKDRKKRLVRIVPSLRARVQFRQINLMDEGLMPPGSMDAIFCRNVIIYFDRETQQRLLARLCGCIKKNGYLFLGHSETVHGFDLPVTRVSSTIYQMTG
jgi:chemotaxis protein methyltransferase CheR